MAKKNLKSVENLEPIAVVDNTTTKSDSKRGANLVEQTENEENEIKKENSKTYIFNQLDNFLFGFNENEETTKLLQAVEMGFITSEEIPAIIAKRKKSAIDSANNTTVSEFAKKLESFPRSADLKKICGFAPYINFSLLLEKVTENGKAIIYHSISEESEIKEGSKKSTYGTKTITKKDFFKVSYSASVWVEYAEITTENLIKAIRYFSVFDSAGNKVDNQIKKANKPVWAFRDSAKELQDKGKTKEEIISLLEEWL